MMYKHIWTSKIGIEMPPPSLSEYYLPQNTVRNEGTQKTDTGHNGTLKTYNFVSLIRIYPQLSVR